MKLLTTALGAGIAIGYLAADEEARNKVWARLKQAKGSPQASSLEGKVNSAVSHLSAKRPSVRSDSADWGDTSLSSEGDTSALSLPVPDRSLIG
jgi:hypothetical protein